MNLSGRRVWRVIGDRFEGSGACLRAHTSNRWGRSLPLERRNLMGVFKKQGVYWIDYYVSGQRKRERIGPDKRLADTVLRKRKVEIAEGKYLDKRKVPRCTFHELSGLYLAWAKAN